jgi:hypothetical protein
MAMTVTVHFIQSPLSPFSYAMRFLTPKKEGGRLLVVFAVVLAFSEHQDQH